MRLRLRRFVYLIALLAATGGSSVSAQGVAEADCQPDTIGVPPESANDSRAGFLGREVGQTFFVACDTLVSKITVWRPPNDRSAIPTRVIVTEVDASRDPPRPNTAAILLKGPALLVYDSDPPGQFIEMPFVIDPPLHLPGTGFYAFFLQDASCSGGTSGVFVANNTNPYLPGMFWLSFRAGGCALAPAESEPQLDLIFRIEFRDSATPTRSTSWGRVKILYR